MDKIELIKKMVDSDPKNGDAWYLLGLEYVEQGNLSEALQAFSEAIKYCDEKLKNKILSELAKLSFTNILGTASDVCNDMKNNNQKYLQDNEDEFNKRINECEEFINDIEEACEGIVNEIQDKIEDITKSNNTYTNSNNPTPVPLRVIGGGKRDSYIVEEDRSKKTITFKDVGGLEGLKETINMKIIKPFSNPGLFSKYKKKIGGGILLYGPPGCGKTFIAKATAGECNAKFIPVHITDILDPYLGVSSENLREIFSKARAQRPCVLFFDEIDTIGFNRSKLSSEVMRPVIDQLLAEIEGVDSSTDKMLIIGATNTPWDLDAALKRPGRFDKSVFILPPDELAREAIFELKMQDRPTDKINYGVLAQSTELYSGADIENVVEVATENIISEIIKTGVERPITMKDLLRAIEGTKPSTIEWLKTVKNYVKYANQSGYYDEVEQFLNKHKRLI